MFHYPGNQRPVEFEEEQQPKTRRPNAIGAILFYLTLIIALLIGYFNQLPK